MADGRNCPHPLPLSPTAPLPQRGEDGNLLGRAHYPRQIDSDLAGKKLSDWARISARGAPGVSANRSWPVRLIAMLALGQSDSANRSPSSTAANSRGLRRPTRSVRKDLSIVITCDTFTTEGFDNPAPLVGS